jgi:hypothetical protein
MLTPLKTRMLDLLRYAGSGGISGDDLYRIAYDGQLPRYQGGHAGRGEQRQRASLKANVWQLNQTLRGTGWRIVGSQCAGGWYRLQRQSDAAAKQAEVNKPAVARETLCRCGTPIRVGLTWCDSCRRHVRREAAKRAARSRRRKITLAKIGARI